MDVEKVEGMESVREKDDLYRRELLLLFKTLRSQALCNIEYFKNAPDEYGRKFHDIFNRLYRHIDNGIDLYVDDLMSVVHLYDFSPSIPANGYRSFILVIHKCCLHILQLSRHISVNRQSFLFRSNYYSLELGSYVSALGQLRACVYYLKKLIGYCKAGELFGDEAMMNDPLFDSLLKEVESLDQECFYGRCLGFQFTASMQKPLSAIVIALASFSEGYGIESAVYRLYSSMVTSGKYLLDPEQRAEKVVTVTRNADINFCKAFWDLNETSIMHQMPLLICPSVQVDKVFQIPANQFSLPSVDGQEDVTIAPPTAHSGPAPVNVRLLSAYHREGMESLGLTPPTLGSKNKSDCLVIQCHGGGFVAQSSASHQVYLRHWVKDLEAPMMCVDYSLAPDHPFPRAFQECFFAYAWALKNCHKLGSTCKRVCLVGDSAGANLILAVAMRAAQLGIRPPDGIVCAYATVLIRYTPSASRLLTLMDPLLPIGVLSRCLAAYADISHPCPAEFYSPTRAAFSSHDQTKPIISQNKPLPGSPHPIRKRLENDLDNTKKIDIHLDLHVENGIDTSLDESNAQVLPDSSKKENGVDHPAHYDIIDLNNQSPLIEKPTMKRRNNVSKDFSLNLNSSRGQQCFNHHKRSPSLPIFINTQNSNPHAFKSAESPLAVSPDGDRQFGSPPTYAMVRHFAQSPMCDMRHVPISDDPYMSPYLASDSLISGLPSVHMVATHLDPCLDDSIMFAKRLSSLGKEVHLEVLEELPHGFLNFVLISREAKQGSDRVVRHIAEVLKLNVHTFNDEDWDEISVDEALN